MGKLNFRSIMHRIWQVLAGRTHCQSLQHQAPGKALLPPALPGTPCRWPCTAGKEQAEVQRVLSTAILSLTPPLAEANKSQPYIQGPSVLVTNTFLGGSAHLHSWCGVPIYWFMLEQSTAS